MTNLKSKKRQEKGKKVKYLREEGKIPAILYGPKIKENIPLWLDEKEFLKVYEEEGEGTLINLEIEGEKEPFSVLIHNVQIYPLDEKVVHVDFYQPILGEEIEATVPLVFEGESLAVKNLGGTLIKNLTEIEIKAKPRDIPKEIKVDISVLKTFDDILKVSDLKFPQGVVVLREGGDIVAQVVPPEEEEVAKAPEAKEEGEEKEKEEVKKATTKEEVKEKRREK